MFKIKNLNYYLTILLLLLPMIAFADDDSSSSSTIGALAPAIAFGLAAIGGTFAQGKAISSFMEAVGRNPGAAGSLRTMFIVGLVFIETLVLFGFVVAYILA
jgi:F-type H+-transporting ATPase subunit c